MARKNLLHGLKRPKSFTFEHEELSQNYGKFVASPFEPGFGTTLGNTLRRVLLSSVSSEFETIPNIVEDTLEVINNLKQIRLRLPYDVEQEVLLYEWSGKCKK
jgi:DNA-directed RNA polymerase subunit alpha